MGIVPRCETLRQGDFGRRFARAPRSPCEKASSPIVRPFRLERVATGVPANLSGAGRPLPIGR
eukprot:13812464-Alexandrium_andersonii.AAC.1